MTETPDYSQQLWKMSLLGQLYPNRPAEFWQRSAEGNAVDCQLCYRQCRIEPGSTGWCKHRGANYRGDMYLATHGVVSCLVRQQRGYQVDPFLTYKPGALSLFVGGVHCTAGCSFCMSTDITWNPDRLKWAKGEKKRGSAGGWYGYRAMAHPMAVIEVARAWGCTQVLLGINEPMLTFEFTYDVAKVAKQAGLDLLIETNGFSLPDSIKQIGPFVDAVDVGIKGSGDEKFYDRWMKSPGAMPYVLEAAKVWQDVGVHLIVGDVIAPPHMQTTAAAVENQKRLYNWIAENLGSLTPVLITPMMQPGPQQSDVAQKRPGGLLLGQKTFDIVEYMERISHALEIAQAAGLYYAHQKTNDEVFVCHNCGGELLRFQSPMKHCNPCIMPTHYCPWWTHQQHVVNGRCEHCNAIVPIATLGVNDLERTRETTRTYVGDGSGDWEITIEQREMSLDDQPWKTIPIPLERREK